VDEINHADEDSTSSVSRENSGARRGRPVNRRRMLISGTRALAGAAVARSWQRQVPMSESFPSFAPHSNAYAGRAYG
jgi:hypothetical protein